jgi:uncharacterized protein (TIGR03437 family)
MLECVRAFGILSRSAPASRITGNSMKHNHISVLSLAVFGAASAYSQITLNPVAERAVGTPRLTVENSPQSPNLVEGREFYAPETVALDNSVSPPILYVSDYVNNRVLAWKNAATFTTGQIADLAIGQPDLLTTFPAGPSAVAQKDSSYTTGLFRPSGLAVDTAGNLYVVDGGNNRVLRFPKQGSSGLLAAFAQTTQFPQPDLWIGQTSVDGYGPNSPGGTATPTAQGLLLSGSNVVLISNLAFDSSGNLWVVDTGNARVLRFPAANLAAGGGSINADLELGQPSLTSTYPALNSTVAASFLNVSQFVNPACLGFDSSGNLFVGDYRRVVVFTPPFSSGMSASTNILGQFPSGYTFPTTQTALQALSDQTTVVAPTGLFFPTGSAAGVGVVDGAFSRIMIFPPFASWSASAPPNATTIIGQPATCAATAAGTCKAPNGGNPQPSNSVFATPGGVAYTGTDLYLADSGNNRVLDLPQQQNGSFGGATRILGQDYSNTNSPDLIEGREFDFTGTQGSDAAMAVDNSSGTPHLYVADPYNNRVLGFKDLRTFQNGAKNKADIVLGQADFTTALVNFPSGNANSPTSTSLNRPVGLVVDANGNLYVADSLNGRVLRFPAPFAYTGSAPEAADLVLGQSNFTTTITDPTSTNMFAPYGLAFSPSCNTASQACAAPNGLVVSDEGDNRVLYIPTTNGTFTAGAGNGTAATVVFGQSSFNTTGTGNALTAMNGPHHVSCDTNGYVYVADTGNNRVLIFPDPHAAGTAPTGEQAAASIPQLSAPESVYVSPVTGEIWVANTGAGDALRFQNYQDVLFGQGSISGIIDESGNFGFAPLAVTQDQYGDLFLADTAHRVALYFPGVNLCNGASFLPTSATSSTYPSSNCLPGYDAGLKSSSDVLPSRPLAPGVIATIFPCENCNAATQFLTSQNVFTNYPVPTTLGDVEVLVSWQTGSTTTSVAAPLYIVYPGQINFIMPQEAPNSGTVDLEVIQVSTGQILGAAGQVPMYAVAPGAFPYPGGQTGATVYAAALNYNADGTYAGINSGSNPATPGGSVSLYMTGEGAIPGEPADGVPASAALSAQYPVTVLLNYIDVNDPSYQESNIQHILYSGINQYPGMWQINVLIPKTVVPSGGAVSVVAVTNGAPNWDATSPFKTYIYVK